MVLEMNTDAKCLKKCVSYMHGEAVRLGGCDLSLLLDVAHFLEIPDMCEDIFKYLQRTLSIPSFVCTKKLAEKHNNSELILECESFATRKFEELAASEVFSFLDFNDILSRLQSDNIKVSSWIRVYEAILRWAKEDIGNRQHLFERLFRHINLVNIPLVYKVERMENEALIRQTGGCLERVFRSYNDAHEYSEGMILMCGICTQLKAYHPYSERWYSIPPLEHDYLIFGATIVATVQYLYVLMVDGTAYRRSHKSHESQWKEISSLNGSLNSNLPAIGVDDFVYVFRSGVIARYDPQQDIWSYISDIKRPREKFCVTNVKECIYCIGGSEGGQNLSIVDRFDTVTNTWCDIVPMNTPKNEASAVTLHNSIYVIDGQENVVEYYDLNTTWTFFRTGSIPHNELHDACVVNGEIFTLSGSYLNSVTSIRSLDLVTKEWKEIKHIPKESSLQFRCISVTKREDFDVTIRVGSREIKAHRRILTETSDYFRAMFSHEMKESISGVVDMKEIDFYSLHICISFIYGDDLPDLSQINIANLLHCGTLLQLKQMVDQICTYWERKLCLWSFADIKNLANFYNCEDLENKCDEFIVKNFENMTNTHAFQMLDKDYLVFVLTSDNLEVSSEIVLYRAIIHWIRYDESSRSKYFVELFSHVNLIKIPAEEVSNVIEREILVRSSKLCSLQVQQSFRERNREHEAIVAVDRQSWHLRAYCLKSNRWKILQAIPQHMKESMGKFFQRIVTLQLEDHIYLITRECVLYRLEFRNMRATWSWMADMDECQYCEVSGVVQNGCIYAFGDEIGEKYDPRRNNWRVITQTTNKCEYAIAALQGWIYFIGGVDTDEGDEMPSNTVDRYNPSTNIWEYRHSLLNTHRHAAAAVVFEGKIYVLGGINDEDMLNSVEIYIPEERIWTTLVDMQIPRTYFRVCILDGNLIALGGDESSPKTMEVFSPERNDWEIRILSDLELVSKSAVTVKFKYEQLI